MRSSTFFGRAHLARDRCFRISSPYPGLAIGIKVRDKESIDRALRRFKRTVNRARVLREYRDNLAFTKPSDVRREARKEAAKKARRASRRYY